MDAKKYLYNSSICPSFMCWHECEQVEKFERRPPIVLNLTWHRRTSLVKIVLRPKRSTHWKALCAIRVPTVWPVMTRTACVSMVCVIALQSISGTNLILCVTWLRVSVTKNASHTTIRDSNVFCVCLNGYAEDLFSKLCVVSVISELWFAIQISVSLFIPILCLTLAAVVYNRERKRNRRNAIPLLCNTLIKIYI